MITVLVNYLIFILILVGLILILFKKFNLNNKIVNITKLNLNYPLILICCASILILFILKPNIIDKIKGHEIFVSIDSKNVKQIDLLRISRGNSKKRFKIKKTDSIDFFINKIQKINFHFFGGIGGGNYHWICEIKKKDSSVFRVDFEL